MELNIASRNNPTDIMSALFLVSLAGSGGERSRVDKVKSKMLSWYTVGSKYVYH